MVQFQATPIAPGKMACTVMGVEPDAAVEVGFHNLSGGQRAVRTARATYSGTVPIDFADMSRDHAVTVTVNNVTHRLIYPAEQPSDGGLLLTEAPSAAKIAPEVSIFTPSVQAPEDKVGDEETS